MLKVGWLILPVAKWQLHKPSCEGTSILRFPVLRGPWGQPHVPRADTCTLAGMRSSDRGLQRVKPARRPRGSSKRSATALQKRSDSASRLCTAQKQITHRKTDYPATSPEQVTSVTDSQVFRLLYKLVRQALFVAALIGRVKLHGLRAHLSPAAPSLPPQERRRTRPRALGCLR